MPLPADARLYQALVARDARFDGVFFVGVTTTRVYCRPVCRAPKPRADRCRYYASAAAAERRGFRPCLRCRPELAPGRSALGVAVGAAGPGPAPAEGPTASVDAVAALAHRAAARIAAGALDRPGSGDPAGVDALAAALGVSARHLRRAVERTLGATPVELAQTHRLLTAKRLLAETALPVTRVAFASGFRSVRRLNALFQARYRLAPSAVRRSARPPADPHAAGALTLSLAYRPPYEWPAVLAYLAARATPGVEAVRLGRGLTDGGYHRTLRLHGRAGVAHVTHCARTPALRVTLSPALLPVLVPLLARLRRLLDLDADPAPIAAHLGADPALAPLVARRPGLRVPGAVDGFELALRAVLGQQVSVRGASTLAGRLARLVGEPLPAAGVAFGDPFGSSDVGGGSGPSLLALLPVTAERLADADPALVAGVGLPRARAECVVALARAAADGAFPELTADVPAGDPAGFMRRFQALPGVGAWTAAYVAMRALGWPDAFPDGDLALRKAAGGLSPARLRTAAERWRPWRAYAAQHLWASLGDAERSPAPPRAHNT